MRHSIISSARVLGMACLAALSGVVQAQQSAPSVAGNGPQSIRPHSSHSDLIRLFANRCLHCHSGSRPAGEVDLTRPSTVALSDPRVIELSASRLWKVIREDEMPPDDELSADEKALIEQWISAGAPHDFEPIELFRYTTDRRAGYDWWSFQPIADPVPPRVAGAHRVRTPIDAFVLRELEQRGMSFSPDAEPRQQIRRLYVDLTGLPAPPEVIHRFELDPSDAAYAAIVDALLDSPEYGERWARHWLDIVRYGESDGFERNGPRKESWPYRDWVINSMNADLPFDEFARRQIAGDAFCDDPIEGIVATGFLVAGVHNTVVGTSKPMQLLARQDELEDIVGIVGQTFVGLTFNCARCHDHKFDPILQQEYYQLVATMAGVSHGSRTAVSKAARQRLDELAQCVDDLRTKVEQLEAPARARIMARRSPPGAPPPAIPRPIAAWSFPRGLEDRIGLLGARIVGDALQTDDGLKLDGEGDFAVTEPITNELGEKTLAAWVQLDDLNQQGGAVISIETLDGAIFDAVVFGEQEPQRWMAGSDGFSRTTSFAGPAETTRGEPVHIAITFAADGTVAAFRNGSAYGKSYQSSGPKLFPANSAHVLFGQRHSTGGSNRFLKGTILSAELYDRALPPEEIAASAGTHADFVTVRELEEELSQADRDQRANWIAQLERLIAERKEVETTGKHSSYTAVFSPPGETQFLPRGDVMNPGPVVQPGAISAISTLSPAFDLEPGANEWKRRVCLANWLTHERNPLFRRVIVNRLWHYHFGRGIISTPNDFGFNGGLPSHPELLDWLASTLRNNGNRLKPLHRLMVLATTYRQGSRFDPGAAKQDADNRWLWRKSPARLEAEVVRDSLLFVSGKLNVQRGGPGYVDVNIIDQNNGTTYYQSFDREDVQLNRRTIYRFSPRGGRSALLDCLDCPDPSTATPRRSVTTTPLQALSLLNDDFVIRMSKEFASLAESKSPDARNGQIDWMFQMALGRAPDAVEADAAAKLVQDHGLQAVARALFNSNEFLIIQ